MKRAGGEKPLLCVPTLDGLVWSPQPTRGARVLNSLPGRWPTAWQRYHRRWRWRSARSPCSWSGTSERNARRRWRSARSPCSRSGTSERNALTDEARLQLALRRLRSSSACLRLALRRLHSSATRLRLTLLPVIGHPPVATAPPARPHSSCPLFPPFPPTHFHNSCRARRCSLSHRPPP